MPSKIRKQEPLSISFKIYEAEHIDRIIAEADEYAGGSRHQRASQIVTEHFQGLDGQNQSLASLESQVKQLRRELRLLRGDLATSVQALLAHAGKEQPQDAARWVHQYLLTEPEPDD